MIEQRTTKLCYWFTEEDRETSRWTEKGYYLTYKIGLMSNSESNDSVLVADWSVDHQMTDIETRSTSSYTSSRTGREKVKSVVDRTLVSRRTRLVRSQGHLRRGHSRHSEEAVLKVVSRPKWKYLFRSSNSFCRRITCSSTFLSIIKVLSTQISLGLNEDQCQTFQQFPAFLFFSLIAARFLE